MDPAWRDSVGIPALDPLYVPQSTTLLLALLALAVVPVLELRILVGALGDFFLWSRSARCLDHRQYAGLHRWGQVRPALNDDGKIGVIRAFRRTKRCALRCAVLRRCVFLGVFGGRQRNHNPWVGGSDPSGPNCFLECIDRRFVTRTQIRTHRNLVGFPQD